MEAASFKLPAVNIGIRQSGRERARNVLDCAANRVEIVNAIHKAISGPFRASLSDLKNPYGDGHAAEKIADILSSVISSESLLAKAPSPIHFSAVA
jgi:UDP-N-acetylglucosamine 2-epimerase